MKIQDLMIGDWVQYTDQFKETHCLKVGLLDDRLGACVLHSSDRTDYYNASFVELRPIPITAEILEKNGWENITDKYKYIRINGREEVLLQFGCWRFPNHGYVSPCAVNTDNKPIMWEVMLLGHTDNPLRCGSKIKFRTNYVHELQHALRLVGIEKEIII